MKAVFDTRPTSGYDDDIRQYYQFPRQYLSIARQCLDDWIVFRRTRADGGNLAYFATARVQSIETDPLTPGMSYARLTEYLAFDQSVPWRDNSIYAEAALRSIPQAQVGVFLRGRSVRALDEEDFAKLIEKGFKETLDVRNAERLGIPLTAISQAAEEVQRAVLAGGRDRRVESVLTNRVIREASFRNNVYEAYDNRCAATGLKIIDNRGNSEVHAAHIWGVADGGPDVVQNGLALSATAHWLFDRYLISIDDDYKLIVNEKRVPREIVLLLKNNDGKILLPHKLEYRPHPVYLKKHRDKFLAV